MKKKTNQADPAAWLRENKWTCAVLAAALVLLMAGRLLAAIQSERGRAELRKADPPYIVYGMKKGASYTEMLQFMEKIRHCITKGNQV